MSWMDAVLFECTRITWQVNHSTPAIDPKQTFTQLSRFMALNHHQSYIPSCKSDTNLGFAGRQAIAPTET